MEWIAGIRGAIQYLEDHLLDEEADPARAVGISPFYLQKGFRILTGCTMAEYVRSRRLYLAALDVIAGKDKVIHIAFKYGYDTPESFTKAFTRFHGVTPAALRRDPSRVRMFLPLKITLTLQGGHEMDYIVEKEPAFQVIGIEKQIPMETTYRDIPKFWDEFSDLYMRKLMRGCAPETEIETAICQYHVGMYGVCLDEEEDHGLCRYLIAGPYPDGGPVPAGMKTAPFPEMDWAKFRCKGPLPGALQAVNTRIFKEWLPGNPAYEIAMDCTIEWYSEGDPQSADYESAIWVPVKRRQAE
ncbi:MAG: AraC family transcriptional regulator [Clostridia bacterium]|nr:AraC family transcriptional regulator [Clostridia bacterium]